MLAPFVPPWWGRHPVVQTLLPLLPFRSWGRNEMLANARDEVVRLSRGISLHGSFSAVRGESRGLVVLFTGWEGHARAPYMLGTGRHLYGQGYDVYRVTYPDHGDTQDLNEAAFHFGMLDQMTEVVSRVLSAVRTRPVALVGFSMGGNLVLNLAARGIAGVKAVVAVSPAFDFGRAITTLERSVFHSKFLGSWKASLARKRELFPHRRDVPDVGDARRVSEIAMELIERSGRVPDFEEYVSRYQVTPEKLARSEVPIHVLAALDDPLVGAIDPTPFARVPNLTLHLQRWGGHVGFLPGLFAPAWYEAAIAEVLGASLKARQLRLPDTE